MATSLIQVRVEDSLKDEAAQVFEKLGIDTSTAVRMFLKRSIMENGIPFRMTLPKEPYRAEKGYRTMSKAKQGKFILTAHLASSKAYQQSKAT